MNNKVTLKGEKDGLVLVVDADIDFNLLMEVLKAKLESAKDFFANSPVPLVVKYRRQKTFSVAENTALGSLFSLYGLVYDSTLPVQPASSVEFVPQTVPVGAQIRPALVIHKTVRGGQEIRFSGNVIIMGDVNPSAKVYAENDIFISGTSRGVVHAGSLGDRAAVVAAGSFAGGQIRIADIIVRAPDSVDEVKRMEKAFVKNGEIIIDF